MSRGHLAGAPDAATALGWLSRFVAITILVAVPASAQEPPDTLRAEDRATVNAQVTPDRPTRLRLFLDDSILSPTLPARVAFSAVLDHRATEPSAWGGGGSGYGRRLAARTGLVLSQAGVQHVTAAALGLDPRGDQSRCACTNPFRRAGHALARTFVTRDSRNRVVPNVPLMVGAAGGAMIARSWYPDDDGPTRDAAQLVTLTIVGQAGANLFREFAPDLKRLFGRN